MTHHASHKSLRSKTSIEDVTEIETSTKPVIMPMAQMNAKTGSFKNKSRQGSHSLAAPTPKVGSVPSIQVYSREKDILSLLENARKQLLAPKLDTNVTPNTIIDLIAEK